MDTRQNCLGYVTGLFGYEQLREIIPPVTFNPEFAPPVPNEEKTVEAVYSKTAQLGFECRRLIDEQESLYPEEKLIAFWGFFPEVTKNFFGDQECAYDFHFAHFVNGQWFHKWGWDDSPAQIYVEKLSAEYRQKPMFFAVRKKTP